jgi:hypothetical protein
LLKCRTAVFVTNRRAAGTTEPKTFSRLILSKPVLQQVGACRKEWFVRQSITGEQSILVIQEVTPGLPLATGVMVISGVWKQVEGVAYPVG